MYWKRISAPPIPVRENGNRNIDNTGHKFIDNFAVLFTSYGAVSAIRIGIRLEFCHIFRKKKKNNYRDFLFDSIIYHLRKYKEVVRNGS